jgi:hypothetical protein
MRIFGNPDAVGCRAVMDHVEIDPDHNPFASFGGEEEGMKLHPDIPMPCANGVPEGAMLAGRQHMITELAVHAFFESVFAESAEERAANATFLRETLGRDFPEASFEGAAT